MWSLFRYFDDDCVVHVLDIGAALGEVPPYQRLVDAGRARVTGFEPDEAACRQLSSLYGGSTHRFMPLFLGDGAEATFRETNRSDTGSLFEPNTRLLEKFWLLESLTRPVAEHRVSTTRLDDIADLGVADFIKIDVQGAELAIFANATKVLDKTLLIQTEVNFVEYYKNQPMFSDVDAFLRAHGFQYHRIAGFGSRPFLPLLNPDRRMHDFNQNIWADVLYVKDWMHIEEFSDEQLRKYAGLMHDILGSYDLAHLALAELDRRTGQDLADRYRRRLLRDGMAILDPDHLLQPSAAPGAKATTPQAAAPLVLETEEGICVSVPATLDCITTYILLEQERWFEREVPFVLRYLTEGMTALDIGANLGVYSLPMARAVGTSGRVVAYEPGAANRRHLEASVALNRLANLQVLPLALSDSPRKGWLRVTNSGELNSIVGSAGASTEPAEITSLDEQAKQFGWQSIDFVKIDAEGQEARVVTGGREFFSRFSPVVMYEVKNASTVNTQLRWMFEAMGFATCRVLGDGSLLVPLGADEALDGSELNLFAIKPDRFAELVERGLLSPAAAEFALDADERTRVLAAIAARPYAQAFGMTPADIDNCSFADAMVAYGAYLFLDGLGPDRRYSALTTAFAGLERHCAEQPSPAALSTLARVACDIGYRGRAIATLKTLAGWEGVDLDQPFFPATPRFDEIPPQGDEAAWFVAAALEQLEVLEEYTSMFAADGLGHLKWLCAKPTVSAALLRRLILVADRLGAPRRDIGEWLKQLQALPTGNRDVWGAGSERLTDLFGN